MKFSPIDRLSLEMLYSPIEKQSIYQVLCAVRQLGQHDMEAKENIINDAMSVIRFTEQDRIQSRNLTQQQMTNVLKGMHEGKKLYFAKFISNVALAGGLTPKEEQVAYLMFEMFEIPNID